MGQGLLSIKNIKHSESREFSNNIFFYLLYAYDMLITKPRYLNRIENVRTATTYLHKYASVNTLRAVN